MSIDLDRALLPLVEKPVRYAGSFSGVAAPASPGVRPGGAFVVPSLMEEGISDPALRSFLAAVNARPGASCEPAFALADDMAARLAESGAPWFTAWTRRPLREEPFLVFCLGSPLEMTTALTILDAAAVSRRASERKAGDPIVVAVLDGRFAPGPLERFFDLFLCGEGPGVVRAWCDLAAASGDPRVEREQVLDRAAGRNGFYVPSRRARVAALAPQAGGTGWNLASFAPPVSPRGGEYKVVTSYGSPPRSRRHASWARAAWAHRPAFEIAAEVSHLLLQPGVRRLRIGAAASDGHPRGRALAEELLRRTLGLGVELIVESFRPARYEPASLPALARTRRSATIAVESGAERLRRVIGTEASDVELVEDAARASFDGVGTLRLLVTLGLPGESAEEAESIVALIEAMQRGTRGARSRPRFLLEIAPFVPRPWTPFQWEGFLDPGEYRRRARLVCDGLVRMKLRPRVRSPEAFFLEAALARGGEEAGDLIERAAAHGARFDHDPEVFRFEKWDEAARALGLDLAFLAGPRDTAGEPPWSLVTFGAGAEDLRVERDRALSGALPPVVEEAASSAVEDAGVFAEDGGAAPRHRYGRRLKPRGPRSGALEEGTRFRLRYAKGGSARFLSHLDLVHLLHAAFLRLRVPPALEKGRQKISFGPPLPVGTSGEDEYFDVELSRAARSDVFLATPGLWPRGVEFREARIIRGEPPSLDSVLNAAVYRVVLDEPSLMKTEWQGRDGALREHLARTVEDFLARGSVPFKGPRGEAESDLREEVIALATLGAGEAPGIRARVWLRMGARTRPADLAAFLLGTFRGDPRLFATTRERLLVRRGEREWTPMEALDLSGTVSLGPLSQPHSVGGIL